MRVLAAVTTGGPLSVEKISLRAPGPGEVRVRLTAAGVCHSDLSLAQRTLPHPLPAVLGHEGTGVVAEVGPDVTGVRVGDHVVLSWRPACRSCRWCLRGQPFLCTRGDEASRRPLGTWQDEPVYPGLGVAAFAEQTVVPAEAVVVVPSDLPPETAALLGCAALTAYGAVRRSARVAPGDSVAVIGTGGVGLIAVQAARLSGAERIIAVDASPAKESAARACGATDFLLAGESARSLVDGGVDHAIECVGSAETIRQAWDMTRRGGVTTVVGAGGKSQQVTFSALELFHSARTLVGCLHGNTDPARDLPELLEHVRTGAIDLDVVVTDRIPLERVGEAFERMEARTGGRSLIVW
ncbi:alcohol dehydrogenase catalytic domain-containing protein [Lentzea sp. NPDC042327]|uniref:alcohol dehydrogenase catalytic domain-containing protein n=1 Tax=Lentzea sp. NPDC042327 TaxID=3154801 RepID=UPI0033D75257